MAAPVLPVRLVWACGDGPIPDTVSVKGSWDSWETQVELARDPEAGSGEPCFAAAVALPPGEYEFKFVLNGTEWCHSNAYEARPAWEGNSNNVVRVFLCEICSDLHFSSRDPPPGIFCVGGHFVCAADAPAFVAHAMENLPANFRCPRCRSDVAVLTFQPFLSNEQTSSFLRFLAAKEPLAAGDRDSIHSCPVCPYWEYSPPDKSEEFFHCVACHTRSCWYCFLPLAAQSDERKHKQCPTLAPSIRAIQSALAECLAPCPRCGLRGVKDAGCTHITCPNCQQHWCYVCERKREECDGGREGSYAEHHHNWETNPRRCPLRLESVGSSLRRENPGWPAEPEGAVAYQSRRRTLWHLRLARDAMGHEQFLTTLAHRDLISPAGFSVEEIVSLPMPFRMFARRGEPPLRPKTPTSRRRCVCM